MSIALMTAAFKTALPSTQKFVLIALCDSANDQGECYPSVRLVAEKCSLGERTVQEAVNALEALGYVRREFRTGRSTVYWLSTTPAAAAPRSSRTPAVAAPTPAPAAPPPPQIAHPTPAVAAPITIKEPSVEPSKKQKKVAPQSVAASVLVAAGFSESAAEEFIAYKAQVKAPLTERAWKDHVTESQKAGWTPMDAADKVMAKSWKGFEAKYVESNKPAMQSFYERDLALKTARVHEMTGGLVSAKTQPITRRNDALQEVFDAAPRLVR